LEVRRNDEGRGERRRWAFFSSLLEFKFRVPNSAFRNLGY
jgi:hypothetical protein